MSHGTAHRVLKYLISVNQRVSEEVSSLINTYVGKLLSLFLKHLGKVMRSKGSYVLISIMENTSNKDLIMDTIKKSKINLNEVVGGDIYLKN